jgi:hypothetical protein
MIRWFRYFAKCIVEEQAARADGEGVPFVGSIQRPGSSYRNLSIGKSLIQFDQ